MGCRFLFFALMTNVIVTGMLLLGGSAVITALTGMNVYAAAFLIPIGIIAYTMSGGLKATFISSYVHTVVIYILLIIFVFAVYATSPDLGSPSKVRLAQEPLFCFYDFSSGLAFVCRVIPANVLNPFSPCFHECAQEPCLGVCLSVAIWTLVLGRGQASCRLFNV